MLFRSSPTRDLIRFAKIRGLPILLVTKQGPGIPITKASRDLLKEARYDWQLTPEAVKVFEPGCGRARSPEERRKRAELKKSAAPPAQTAG